MFGSDSDVTLSGLVENDKKTLRNLQNMKRKKMISHAEQGSSDSSESDRNSKISAKKLRVKKNRTKMDERNSDPKKVVPPKRMKKCTESAKDKITSDQPTWKSEVAKAGNEFDMKEKVAKMLESSSESERESTDGPSRAEGTASDSSGPTSLKKIDLNSEKDKDGGQAEESNQSSGESPSSSMPKKSDSNEVDPKKGEVDDSGKGSTSDTSIDDETAKSKTESQEGAKTCEGSKVEVSKKEKSKDHSVDFRLKKLKRLVLLAGFRFNYKKMFDSVDNVRRQITILENALREKGVHTLTIEACKAFRLKREQEQELAELSENRIIVSESGKRITRASHQQQAKIHRRTAHLCTSSSSDSEAQKMQEDNAQIFARLKGIVSDESE